MATRVPIDPAFFDTSEYNQEPWEHLRYLRDHAPVYYNPHRGEWWVTRYDDIVAALNDTVHYSSQPWEDSFGIVFGPTIIQMDGEAHTRRRNIIAPELVGKRLEALAPIIEQNARALSEEAVRRNAERIAASAAERGEIDLIQDFSDQLPLNVITDLLGFPKEDIPLFDRWYAAMWDALSIPDRRPYGIQCNGEFHDYLAGLIADRRKNPRPDLISRLANAELNGERLADLDIKAFGSLLLVAGGETSQKAIANLWINLFQHPDQFEAVKEDPALLDRAFVETIRHSPANIGMRRRALTDIHLHGETIPAGDRIYFITPSANHDDRVFKDPESFNMFREDLYFGRELRTSGYHESGKATHVAFGAGRHFCAGYQLARLEGGLGSRILLAAMKNPRIKDGQTVLRKIGRPWNTMDHLIVEFDPA